MQEEALRTARRIASHSTLATRPQKELINRRWLRADLEAAMLDGIELASMAFSTGEPQHLARALIAARRAAKREQRTDSPA